MSKSSRTDVESGVGLRTHSRQISSVGVSPVRTSRMLGCVPVSLARTPPSGSISHGSFAWFDQSSWSWKTFQRCFIEGWIPYSETWPRAGTMRSGIVYQLPPSVPLTAVTGSSWSRGEYPTPTANDYGSAQNEGKNVAHKRPTAGTPSLSSWARTWPTATAQDAEASGSRKGPKGHGGTSLTDAAVRSWPTPMATDGTKGGHKGKRAQGSETLSGIVKNWSTPTARDHKGAHSGDWGRGARCLAEDARQWATPTVGNTTGGNKTRGGGKRSSELLLPGQASSHPHPTICSHGEPCQWTLNPLFVEWLQGFPREWTLP